MFHKIWNLSFFIQRILSKHYFSNNVSMQYISILHGCLFFVRGVHFSPFKLAEVETAQLAGKMNTFFNVRFYNMWFLEYIYLFNIYTICTSTRTNKDFFLNRERKKGPEVLFFIQNKNRCDLLCQDCTLTYWYRVKVSRWFLALKKTRASNGSVFMNICSYGISRWIAKIE